ncbi:MAG: hypothetical protein JOZ07_13235 [Solirubrobacterales bacterium]|nr:hypothetical protein [Solirubrobacterales bacterium]
MTPADSLPGDQRATLQLVLGRGRSYEDIGRMLSIDPASVRRRALSALDALGPDTGLDDAARASVGDYLLGQLPRAEADAVRDRMTGSPAERAWARGLAAELAPLASSGPLSELPDEPAAPVVKATEPPMPVDEPEPVVEPVAPAPAATEPVAAEPAEPSAAEPVAPVESPLEPEPPAPAQTAFEPPPAAPPPRRRARTWLRLRLGLAALLLVVLIVLLVTGGNHHHAGHGATTTTATSSSAPSTTSGTATGASVSQLLAQIRMGPGTAGAKASGIADVLREGNENGISIIAENVPPNTASPNYSYVVWLYNSPTDARMLAVVSPGVGASGNLSSADTLPSGAAQYKELIVTRETSAHPKVPGPIVLQGTLAGLT